MDVSKVQELAKKAGVKSVDDAIAFAFAESLRSGVLAAASPGTRPCSDIVRSVTLRRTRYHSVCRVRREEKRQSDEALSHAYDQRTTPADKSLRSHQTSVTHACDPKPTTPRGLRGLRSMRPTSPNAYENRGGAAVLPH